MSTTPPASAYPQANGLPAPYTPCPAAACTLRTPRVCPTGATDYTHPLKTLRADYTKALKTLAQG